MTSGTALVVGAGIGGLASGIALQRAGWTVRVFERAATPRELGFALNVAPNAMLALKELGLDGALRVGGSATASVEIRHVGGAIPAGSSGVILKRLNLATAIEGAPQVIALRPVLHGALLQMLGAEALVLESEAVDVSQDHRGVTLTLQDGRMERGDLLIGADGIGSAIRRRLHPVEPPPRRSGYVAIRGVAYEAERYLGGLSAIAYLGHRVESTTVKAGGGAVYWYVSLLEADVRDHTSLAAAVEQSSVRLGADFRAVAAATKLDDMRMEPLFDRDPIAPWGQGRITLVGDAAHPMLPHTGQGAAQALEDAVSLGMLLGRAGPDVTGALRRYEAVRGPRTRKVVLSGRRIAAVTTPASRIVDSVRATAIQLMPVGPLMTAFLQSGRKDPFVELRAKTTSGVISQSTL